VGGSQAAELVGVISGGGQSVEAGQCFVATIAQAGRGLVDLPSWGERRTITIPFQNGESPVPYLAKKDELGSPRADQAPLQVDRLEGFVKLLESCADEIPPMSGLVFRLRRRSRSHMPIGDRLHVLKLLGSHYLATIEIRGSSST